MEEKISEAIKAAIEAAPERKFVESVEKNIMKKKSKIMFGLNV